MLEMWGLPGTIKIVVAWSEALVFLLDKGTKLEVVSKETSQRVHPKMQKVPREN